jgi:hypothetical protein
LYLANNQNKEARKDKRDTQLVKKDTRDIENEIKSLKSESKLLAKGHGGLADHQKRCTKDSKLVLMSSRKNSSTLPQPKKNT